MAHTLAYLRFAGPISETVARLATGVGGLTLRRTGFAPAGRRTKFHEGIATSNPLRPAGPGRTEFPIPEHRFQQYFRDVHTVSQHGSGSAERFESVGKLLLG